MSRAASVPARSPHKIATTPQPQTDERTPVANTRSATNQLCSYSLTSVIGVTRPAVVK
jgi:hypothetical protein